MIINDLSVSNKVVELTNIKLSFESSGIYLVQGDNGAGKTTLFNEIIFGYYDVSFARPEHQQAFSEKRHTLFTYVPQLIPDISMKVSEFFQKRGSETLHDTYHKYIGAAGISPSRHFNTLSGGEKAFVSVLAALQRNTPYIWLDEPTNNMDDKTVALFLSVLKEHSTNKTIVMISHDPRVIVEPVSAITVERNKVTQQFNKGYSVKQKNEASELPARIPSAFSSALKTALSATSLSVVALLLVVFVALSIVLDNELVERFSLEDLPQKDEIVIQSESKTFGGGTQVYAEDAGIQIDKKDYAKHIHYKDVPQIVSAGNIKTMYMFSQRYFNEHWQDFHDAQELDEGEQMPLPIFGVPEKVAVYSDYMIQLHSLSLDKGRLPKDNMREVAISKALLVEHFGYDEKVDTDSLIGESIEVEGSSYKIVGLSHFNICLLSYQKGENRGFYEYDRGTYQEFMDAEILSLKEEEHIYPESLNSALILTNSGAETKVLNFLIGSFPANDYSSYTVDLIFKKHLNADALRFVSIVVLVISIILALILLFVFRSKFAADVPKIQYYEIYYANKQKMKRMYYSLIVAQLLVVGIVSLAFNYWYSVYAFADTWILAAGYVIVLLPTFVLIALKYKNA